MSTDAYVILGIWLVVAVMQLIGVRRACAGSFFDRYERPSL